MGTGMNSEFVDVASEMNKCSKDCAMKKLQNLNCLQKQKSVKNITQSAILAKNISNLEYCFYYSGVV
jgi:hypothetical protein